MQTPQSSPPPAPVAASNTEQKLADAKAWTQFIQIASLTIGAGLLLAGIIFFFAYNWDAIHRFAKMGIAAGLILATFAVVIFAPMRPLVRNVTMSALCILVGVFWAIFGQAYQTEADAPAFFLTWALCIAVWVYIADFYPLWLFFVWLLTSGVVPLFFIQNDRLFRLFNDNDWGLTLTMLYGAAVIAFFIFTPKVLPSRSEAPKWFINLLFTWVFGVAITTMCITIFGADAQNLIMALIVIGATGWYAIKEKNIWLYSTMLCGGLCVLVTLMVRIRPDIGTILILTIAAMAGAAILIHKKYKKWKQ